MGCGSGMGLSWGLVWSCEGRGFFQRVILVDRMHKIRRLAHHYPVHVLIWSIAASSSACQCQVVRCGIHWSGHWTVGRCLFNDVRLLIIAHRGRGCCSRDTQLQNHRVTSYTPSLRKTVSSCWNKNISDTEIISKTRSHYFRAIERVGNYANAKVSAANHSVMSTDVTADGIPLGPMEIPVLCTPLI